MRYFLALMLSLCLSVPAQAQTNYYNAENAHHVDAGDDADADGQNLTPAHNVVVTSISKCYAQLSPAEALEIQRNYVKPYEECEKRLAAKLKKQQEAKPGQQKTTSTKDAPAKDMTKDDAPAAKNLPPESTGTTSGGFYRVQKDPVAPPVDAKKPSNSSDPKPKSPTDTP